MVVVIAALRLVPFLPVLMQTISFAYISKHKFNDVGIPNPLTDYYETSTLVGLSSLIIHKYPGINIKVQTVNNIPAEL